MVEIGRSGRSPQVTGPPAPPLELVDDPLAWHRMDRLPLHGVRRRRRLDVVAGSTLVVDAMFRDSHMGADGLETVVHEYAFKGVMDSRTFEVLEAEAVDHVLPWTECSLAASSATRLIGKYAGMLRTEVRTELVGPSTCTHLNDLLRSVEDVVALAPLLSADAEG